MSDVSQRLSALFSRVTGLAEEGRESLQVVAYGVGGHYEPHIDFFKVIFRLFEREIGY